jgi:nitrate reductase gamma subunit
MTEPTRTRFPRRAMIVGLATMAIGLAILIFLPRQWLAWSLLLLFAVKHLALVAVAAGPLYAAFGERLLRRRRKREPTNPG